MNRVQQQHLPPRLIYDINESSEQYNTYNKYWLVFDSGHETDDIGSLFSPVTMHQGSCFQQVPIDVLWYC